MVALTLQQLAQCKDLFNLYSKKSAFVPDEYEDCGKIYKKIVSELNKVQSGESQEGELTENDVKYILSAITVCSQRAPIELVNYKPIALFFETLSKLINLDVPKERFTELEEETKE